MEKKEIINVIYQNTLKKVYTAMQHIDILENVNNANYIQTQFTDIVKLLKNFNEDVISASCVKLLNNVTFSDFLLDKNIIEAVSSNSTIVNNSNIFIKKNKENDNSSYYKIIEKDGQYIAKKYCNGDIIEDYISLDEISSFISLGNILNNLEFVGCSAYQWLYKVTILYSGKIPSSDDFFTLYMMKNNSFNFCITDKPYTSNGVFQQIYKLGKNSIKVKYKNDEKCINDRDGIIERELIVKLIEENFKEQNSLSEEGKKRVKLFPY